MVLLIERMCTRIGPTVGQGLSPFLRSVVHCKWSLNSILCGQYNDARASAREKERVVVVIVVERKVAGTKIDRPTDRPNGRPVPRTFSIADDKTTTFLMAYLRAPHQFGAKKKEEKVN